MSRSRNDSYQHLTAGRYLTALHQLQHEYVSWERTPLAANILLWTLNAVDPWGSAWTLSGHGDAPLAGSDLVEPEGPIAAALSTHRVVILMEAHRAPETRYFGARILHALHAAGATHLALEAPWQRPLDQFARTGIVRPNTDPYAFDPSHAALLRIAHTLGLKFVAFDFPAVGHLRAGLTRLVRRRSAADADAETVNRQREWDMAENIVRRILIPHPTARVVVWTGEQHAMKRTPPNAIWHHPFMAAHLAAMTGEEPFCVWQECVDSPELSTGPRLLRGSHPRLTDLGVDAIVLHHRGTAPAYPAWLTAGTSPIHISSADAELIQAIPEMEGEHAVPVTQQLTHGAQRICLHLGQATYLLRGLRGQDEAHWQRRIVVRGDTERP